MKVGIIIFPGSNCDHDLQHAFGTILKAEIINIWHTETILPKLDLLLIPGGFAFGDYLRTGALAKISPIMPEVLKFASAGGPVLGICNGFQILCEAQLLPGALLVNKQTKFISRFITMRCDSNKSYFTKNISKGQLVTCPIAHGEGNYFIEPEGLKKLQDRQQVVWRYCNLAGVSREDDLELNPNGSLDCIAGICNAKGNVLGMMPHPERCVEETIGWLGTTQGLNILLSALSAGKICPDTSLQKVSAPCDLQK